MKCSLTILALLLLNMVHAQQHPVSGKVVNKQTQEPLANVTVQSRNQSTQTDSTGAYRILAVPGEDIKFSFVGMAILTLPVPASGTLDVSMSPLSQDLNVVVVTGYQTQKKADLTGAVSVVDVNAIKDIPLGNPVKSLQGRVPGVFITTDGSPGGGATVRVRGVGTLGDNDPLYVIDGIPTKRGLNELNQDDIETIQVLKDASSATIYGSRAANGVIIVTTKKARKGYNRIDFDASTSLQYYGSKQKTLDADGRGRAYWQAAVNDRSNPNNNQIYQYDWNGDYDNPVLNRIIYPEYIDAAKTMRPANTYWYDEIGQTSLIQQYNLSFSNGGEKGNTLFAIGYYDNKGIVKSSSSSRITARFNSDFNFFNGKLKLGENLGISYIKNRLLPINDILFTSLVQQPVVPVHSEDGGWGGPASGMTDRHNPVRLIEDNKQNKSHFVRVFGNIFADWAILPGLHARTSFGIDYNGEYQRTLRKSYISGFLSDPSNQAQTRQAYSGNWVWQNTLNYKQQFGLHQVDAVLGQETIQFIAQSFYGLRQGYALENIDYAYLNAGSANKDNGGDGSSNSLVSYFGKVNYVYNNRYLASATLRRDGSSRFGKENRYGMFPAFSLGWRISEEGFMKEQTIVSDLKLRFGWGQSGNQEIPNNGTYSLYSAIYGIDPTWAFDNGSAYDINGNGTGQLPSGFTSIQQGNDSLRWESTTESNFGIDFGLFNNKLSGSVDYFIKKTDDILISPGYLAVLGEGGNRYFNGASMQNKGIEVLLTYNTQIGRGLSLTVTGNFSSYRNKVTYLPDAVVASYAGNGTDKTILGRSINARFGYIADGLFRSQKDLDESAEQVGKALGRIRYRDLNGDNVIDDLDRDFIADLNPDFLYGLNVELSYKNFDLSFFIQGVQGVDVWNDFKTFTDFSSLWVGSNWGERTLQGWTKNNPNASVPALTLVNRNNEGRASTYFYENGSYIKLRNIQLSYNLKSLLSAWKVNSARLFIQGSNLLTIKNKSFTAADPEIPNQAFPVPSITSAGFNVSF
ncbi:MAG: TonB-dependent receptor [Candidatus Pseudobacter hemicellulosilyticus]|uniref:TonB-dependent receptor n=1 Tax=Candidatus Pseudobacter hemicellulosilyticus TaxID=3121375 RepID=A0AAJ5WTQ3_9BACT|nr:MAG: TonB-dependent receptor [Pseudobacter sp.]